MKTSLVRIGNSHGVRIPKAIIDQCGFAGQVDLTVDGRVVKLAPVGGRRQGWDEAFKAMAAAGDDAMLLPDSMGNAWDDKEWRW